MFFHFRIFRSHNFFFLPMRFLPSTLPIMIICSRLYSLFLNLYPKNTPLFSLIPPSWYFQKTSMYRKFKGFIFLGHLSYKLKPRFFCAVKQLGSDVTFDKSQFKWHIQLFVTEQWLEFYQGCLCNLNAHSGFRDIYIFLAFWCVTILELVVGCLRVFGYDCGSGFVNVDVEFLQFFYIIEKRTWQFASLSDSSCDRCIYFTHLL